MDTRKHLVDIGCVLEGEFFFALKSGRIATTYVNIDPLLTRPAMLNMVAKSMAASLVLSSAISPPRVVAGPAVGAIPLVYAASAQHYHFCRKCFVEDSNHLYTVFTEKNGDNFILDRLGFKQTVNGRKVWVVEDIATTGQSAKKTAEEIEAAGGIVVAYSFIWNRDPNKVNAKTMGAPVLSLIEEPIDSYVATEHPMWGTWPLVADIGHSDKFPDYPGPRIKLIS